MKSDNGFTNQITETLFHKFKQMYEEIVYDQTQKIKMLEKENKNWKNKFQCSEAKQIMTEKKKEQQKNQNQKLTQVPQGFGYQNQLIQQDESNNKQELKIQNQQDRNKQVIEIKSNQIQQNQLDQRTERKQKKQIEEEKTPKKQIQSSIYQIFDQQKYRNQQFEQKSKKEKQISMSIMHRNLILLRNQQQKFTENKEQHCKSYEKLQQKNFHQMQSEQEQVKLNYHEIILQLERELSELKQNNYVFQDQIKELQDQISQKEQIINQLLQQRTMATSNDTTLTIEKIEENLEVNNKQVQGKNKLEQNFVQNQYQVEQPQNQKLQDELNLERNKNLELMRNQQNFMLRLQDIYRKSKIKYFLMKKMEDEDDDNEEQEQIVSETQFLKEWKINFEQLADELGEYEENERNLKQQMEIQEKNFKQQMESQEKKYQELSNYYEQAYYKLDETLNEVNNLNQQIQNQNLTIQDQTIQIAQLKQKIPLQENQGNQMMIDLNDQQQQIIESEDLNNQLK